MIEVSYIIYGIGWGITCLALDARDVFDWRPTGGDWRRQLAAGLSYGITGIVWPLLALGLLLELAAGMIERDDEM